MTLCCSISFPEYFVFSSGTTARHHAVLFHPLNFLPAAEHHDTVPFDSGNFLSVVQRRNTVLFYVTPWIFHKQHETMVFSFTSSNFYSIALAVRVLQFHSPNFLSAAQERDTVQFYFSPWNFRQQCNSKTSCCCMSLLEFFVSNTTARHGTVLFHSLNFLSALQQQDNVLFYFIPWISCQQHCAPV